MVGPHVNTSKSTQITYTFCYLYLLFSNNLYILLSISSVLKQPIHSAICIFCSHFPLMLFIFEKQEIYSENKKRKSNQKNNLHKNFSSATDRIINSPSIFCGIVLSYNTHPVININH